MNRILTMNTTIPNIHPGEVLLEEFLKPMEISKNKCASDIAVPATRIGNICAGKRAITADTALRLSRYFGTTPQFWTGLQTDYDLAEEETLHKEEYANIKAAIQK